MFSVYSLFWCSFIFFQNFHSVDFCNDIVVFWQFIDNFLCFLGRVWLVQSDRKVVNHIHNLWQTYGEYVLDQNCNFIFVAFIKFEQPGFIHIVGFQCLNSFSMTFAFDVVSKLCVTLKVPITDVTMKGFPVVFFPLRIFTNSWQWILLWGSSIQEMLQYFLCWIKYLKN